MVFLLSIGQFKIRIKKRFIFSLQYHEIWSVIMQKPFKRGDAWRITVCYLGKLIQLLETLRVSVNNGPQKNY